MHNSGGLFSIRKEFYYKKKIITKIVLLAAVLTKIGFVSRSIDKDFLGVLLLLLYPSYSLTDPTCMEIIVTRRSVTLLK